MKPGIQFAVLPPRSALEIQIVNPDVFEYIGVYHFRLLVVADFRTAYVVYRRVDNADVGAFRCQRQVDDVSGTLVNQYRIVGHDFIGLKPSREAFPVVCPDDQ